MTDTLLQRTVLPVASVDDAETTCERVRPRLRDLGSSVLAVPVIEKAGGAPDKASVEQRERLARDIFAADTARGPIEGATRPVAVLPDDVEERET